MTTLIKKIEDRTYQILGVPFYHHQRGWQFDPTTTSVKENNRPVKGIEKNSVLSKISSNEIRNK